LAFIFDFLRLELGVPHAEHVLLCARHAW
jgi:hypothetical protein